MFIDALRRQPKLAAALVPLLAGAVVLQAQIDPLRRQPAIEPDSNKMKKATGFLGNAGVPFEFTLGALTGFRSVIAGLLWVRADSFFHSGNYNAILPMIRLITWLDPNWLDVYATGAWHLMYNFTDTDQRSDRRYLIPGLALLNEGIANNPNVYDVYKEKGWNLFDKVRDYPAAAKAYEDAFKHDAKADATQVLHALGHSYERAGLIDESIATWERAVKVHQERLADPKLPADLKANNSQGLKSSQKNLSLLQIRKAVRPKDTTPPVDARFSAVVKRLSPRVLEVSGTFNLVGTQGPAYFDAGTFDKEGRNIQTIGKGMLAEGPRDGARLEVRLQDVGYKMEPPDEFDLQVDPNTTLMQEMCNIKGGKRARAGEPFALLGNANATPVAAVNDAGIYFFTKEEAAPLRGIPIAQAIASGRVNATGQKALVTWAYPKPYLDPRKFYTDAEVPAAFAKLRGDTAKIAELTKLQVHVAQSSLDLPGKFKRKIDMSKDPLMYGFAKDKFELILWFNPRVAPDFIQDRIGWNGEGLTDKKYLVRTDEPFLWIDHKRSEADAGIKTAPLNMIRVVIPLTREQILGSGEEVLWKG